MALLRQRRVDQRAERLAWGSAWQHTGLVFTREDGTALRPDYLSHLFVKLAERAGVPRIRLHDLRHTNASLALAAGVPLKVVSHRLGHSSTATTSDLYTHVIPAVAQDAADRIGALIQPLPQADNEPASYESPTSATPRRAGDTS